jgi:hypothetical protein
MAQIRSEYAACQQALRGLALGTAKHAFMTAKTERLAQRVEELRQVAGEEVVKHVLIQLGEGTQEKKYDEVSPHVKPFTLKE